MVTLALTLHQPQYLSSSFLPSLPPSLPFFLDKEKRLKGIFPYLLNESALQQVTGSQGRLHGNQDRTDGEVQGT